MALTARDLVKIRRIVREELERSFGHSPVRAIARPSALTDSDDDESEPQHRALANFARWSARADRGEAGAADEALRAEAVYRGQHDAGWRRRARRKLGMTSDEPLEVDDALRALRLMNVASRRSHVRSDLLSRVLKPLVPPPRRTDRDIVGQ
jgi:hypothetical protein